MMKHNDSYSLSSSLSIATVLLLGSGSLNAEFSLNFSPNDNITSNISNVHCTSGGGDGVVPGSGGWGGGWGGGGGFPYFGCGGGYFIQEVVRDPELGSYYHVILGEPDKDEFSMEFYLSGDYNSDSGGDWYNANNPLGDRLSVTGNGTGNPKRIYMHVINNDAGGGFSQELIKAQQSQKPLITQSIVSDTMTAKTVIDMTNSNYDQDHITGIFENTIVFSGADQGTGDFDMAIDVQKSTVTAGRYTYNSGFSSRWGSSYGSGGEGSYSYVDGGFELDSVDWESYCIDKQNPDHNCNFNRSFMGGSWGMGGGGGDGGWGW